MSTKKLTRAEVHCLTDLHLLGCWKNSGNMTKKRRLEMLLDLTRRGYLDDKCRVTDLGISASSPLVAFK